MFAMLELKKSTSIFHLIFERVLDKASFIKTRPVLDSFQDCRTKMLPIYVSFNEKA